MLVLAAMFASAAAGDFRSCGYEEEEESPPLCAFDSGRPVYSDFGNSCDELFTLVAEFVSYVEDADDCSFVYEVEEWGEEWMDRFYEAVDLCAPDEGGEATDCLFDLTMAASRATECAASIVGCCFHGWGELCFDGECFPAEAD